MRRDFFYYQLRESIGFFNRTTELDALRSILNNSRVSGDRLHVVSLVGMGGFGKTAIMQQLSEAAANEEAMSPVWVSLATDANNRIAGPLLSIRKYIPAPCVLFDTALTAYYSSVGLPFPKHVFGDNIFVRIAEATGSAFGIATPIGLAVDVYKKLSALDVKERLYNCDDFEKIDSMRGSPFELLESMPHLLAKDIRIHREIKDLRFVFFYDAYERQSQDSKRDKSDWLQRFILDLGSYLHIIASREVLRWSGARWDGKSSLITIGRLSRRDSNRLVMSVVKGDRSAVNRILAVARGVPLYLRICLSVYRATDEFDPEKRPQAFAESIDDVTDKLFSHLGDDIVELVLALAAIQIFDIDTCWALVQEMNFSVSINRVNAIANLFFMEVHSREYGLFKVHDLITDYVRRRKPEYLGYTVPVVARYWLDRLEADQSPCVVSAVYGALLRSYSYTRPIPEVTQHLITIGYWMHDHGLWNELISIYDEDAIAVPSVAAEISRFFYGLSLRRKLGVAQGRSVLLSLASSRREGSRLDLPLEIELAYLGELRGGYVLASHQMAQIFEQCKPLDCTNRAHMKCLLYHADLKLLDGQMRSASIMLQEVIDRSNDLHYFDEVEFLRSRGHAYRLSHEYVEAEYLYSRALARARGAPAMVGKLRTNIAESLALISPRSAIEEARVALEINTSLGNQIEIGKCLSVLAIASAGLKCFEAARDHYEHSERVFRQANYKAGALFAMTAKLIVNWKADHLESVRTTYHTITRVVNDLGVYRSLLLLPAILVEDSSTVERVIARTEWTDPDRIRRLVEDVVADFRSI